MQYNNNCNPIFSLRTIYKQFINNYSAIFACLKRTESGREWLKVIEFYYFYNYNIRY